MMVIVLHRLFMSYTDNNMRILKKSTTIKNQALHTNTRVKLALSTEDEWCGRYGPLSLLVHKFAICIWKEKNWHSIQQKYQNKCITYTKFNLFGQNYLKLKDAIKLEIPGAKAAHTIKLMLKQGSQPWQ